jgi:hypothetical protein
MSKRIPAAMRRNLAKIYNDYLIGKGEDGGNCADWIEHMRRLVADDPALLGLVIEQALPTFARKVWHDDPKPLELEAEDGKQKRKPEQGLLAFWPESIHGIKLDHTYTVPAPPAIEEGSSNVIGLDEARADDSDCQRISVWHATVQTNRDAAWFKMTKAEQSMAKARRDVDEAEQIAAIANNDPSTLLRDICDQKQRPNAA